MDQNPYQPPEGDEHSPEAREVRPLPVRPRVGMLSGVLVAAALFLAMRAWVHANHVTNRNHTRAVICAVGAGFCLAAAYASQIRKPPESD